VGFVGDKLADDAADEVDLAFQYVGVPAHPGFGRFHICLLPTGDSPQSNEVVAERQERWRSAIAIETLHCVARERRDISGNADKSGLQQNMLNEVANRPYL